MSEPISKEELGAYVDGELPQGRRAEVESALTANPALAEEVRVLREINEHVGAAIRGEGTEVPNWLKDLIGGMEVGETAPARRKVIGWPLGLVAAALAGAITVGVWMNSGGGGAGTGAGGTKPEFVALVSMTETQHLECEQMEDHFFDSRFPKALGEVGPAVASRLNGGKFDVPDLSGMGYVFAGAGPCPIPGGKTVHLLYRKQGAAPGSAGSCVSVFVQAWEGQLKLDEGQQVVVAGPDAKHPMLAWREKGVACYLMGDDFGTTEKVAGMMGRTFAMAQ